MKVLVIGKGGREHALCWKLKQSPRVQAVYCAPGNAGTALDVQNVPIEPGDQRGLIQFARKEGIGLTVVGPEEPLAKGIVDLFQRDGLRIFGPRKDAAELEGSKVFAKDLMRQAGIPTADYRMFRSAPDAEHYILSREVALVVRSRGRSTIRHTLHCRTAAETLEAIDRILDPREMLSSGVQVEIEERGQRRVFNTVPDARDFVLGRPLGLVLKADGLAAGKGVYVCDNLRQALDAIDQIMIRRIYGQAGDRLIIEERLDGFETSVLALTDGRTIIPLESSQDYKRAFDHDEGPNTGGMGAFSPTPRRDARPDGRGRAGDPRPGRARAEARPPAVPRGNLRRAHAHEPGPQGARVQRPVRRPGDPGHPDAAQVRPARRPRGRRRRAPRHDRPAVGHAPLGDRGGPRRVIPATTSGIT